MNWDAVSAGAEVVAAIGVVASLLYLAMQVRSYHQESRLAATRELTRDWHDFMNSVISNNEAFELYQRAIKDYDSLSGGDRIRAFTMFTCGMRIIELQYFHVQHARFDSRFFSGIRDRLQEIGNFPGIQQFWKGNKQQFDPEFIAFAERESAIGSAAG